MSKNKNKMREEMIETFLNALQEDKIPWHKSWSAFPPGIPRNAVKDTEYRGINRFWLFHTAEQNGYSDPRWCTYKQARDSGWQVRKGEKGTHVEFWSLYDRETRKTISSKEADVLRQQLSPEEYAERVKPVANNYTVFNAEQIEGIPKLPEAEIKTYELDENELVRAREVLFENMDVLFQEGGERAFYRPSEDCIHLPEIRRFESEYDYMATLLHEAGHATGHESRLNRPNGNEFGSPEYAKEELRAEIASAFTVQTLHLSRSGSHIENHKAYIQSWIKILKDEPDELFRAIRDAEKISDYLVEKGEFDLEHSKEKDLVSKEKSFSEQVDEVLSGKANRYNDLKVCDTPQILLDAGCEQLPMLYTKAHLRKALLPKDAKKHNHGLNIEQVKRLPEYMQEPVMLIDSSTREDSIIIVLSDMDSENSPLVATVRPNGKGTYDLEVQDSNFITSVYGRDNFEQFLEVALENNMVLYWNKTKSQELFSVLGLQFPKGFNNLDYDIIIHQSNNIVKEFSGNGILEADLGREVSEGIDREIPSGRNGAIAPTDFDKEDRVMTLYDKSTNEVASQWIFNDVSQVDLRSIEAGANGWDRFEVAKGDTVLFQGDVTEQFENDITEWFQNSFLIVSGNLAWKLQDEGCRIYTMDETEMHFIDSPSELYETGKEKTLYVRKEDFAEGMEKEFFPTVTCEWSEHNCFDDGKTYLVSEFNREMEKADQEWYGRNRGGEENAMHYAKIKFQINLSAEGEKIVERQDIGDGYGSMIDFLRKTGGIRYQRAAEQLEEVCTLEKEFMNYQEKMNGIFQQEEGHLSHPGHALGNHRINAGRKRR